MTKIYSGFIASLMAISCAYLSPALAQERVTLQERVTQCNACHGEGGNSSMDLVPSLAGQPDFFLLNQLVLLREGVRKIDAMADIVKGLRDEDIQALAAHYAQLPAQRMGDTPDKAKVEQGAKLGEMKRCNSCHGPSLSGDQQVPRIAKQRIDYLYAAMKAYRDNTRTGADTSMSAMIFGLSDADLEALAHYAASR